jgi:hypothetical protein
MINKGVGENIILFRHHPVIVYRLFSAMAREKKNKEPFCWPGNVLYVRRRLYLRMHNASSSTGWSKGTAVCCDSMCFVPIPPALYIALVYVCVSSYTVTHSLTFAVDF